MAENLPDIASKLFPNLTTWSVQLVATFIMLCIFKKFLWKPMMDFFAARADAIEKNINDAKDMRDQAQALMEESNAQARDAAVQYRDIIERAKDDAKKQSQVILDEADAEARKKLAAAREEIESEKAQARDQMKEEIVSIATEVAEKIMAKEITSSTNDEMVKAFVDEVVN